jgi:diacylglycerol kinase family enzyme
VHGYHAGFFATRTIRAEIIEEESPMAITLESTLKEVLDNPKAAKHFIYRQSKTVDVHSDKQIELCLDGEMLPGTDFHIEIIPSAISFIIPA